MRVQMSQISPIGWPIEIFIDYLRTAARFDFLYVSNNIFNSTDVNWDRGHCIKYCNGIRKEKKKR
jgi:hypothetical protein